MKKCIPLWLLASLFFTKYGYAQVLINDKDFRQVKDSVIQVNPQALNFIVMGDWGRNGDDHQRQVAEQMGKTAALAKSQFVIATGDNFYPSGVISEYDPLFHYSFEDIYTSFSLQWDWYPVLGNHDYKSNPDAEVAYSTISRRWKMPARYYAKKFFIHGDSTEQVLIAFIDTNPLIPEFYRNTEYGPNVRSQDSAKQKAWLEKVLGDPSPYIKWRIVVGHHPMFTGGSRTEGYDTRAIRNSLQPIFDKYKVDAYLAGHEHNLQYLKQGGPTHHFISGAASERTPVRLIPGSKLAASAYGFMLFSVSGTAMQVQVIDDHGQLIYYTQIKK
ncbi:MAG: acid phosphatase [Terrimonas sp.]|nr:acid phosphatase [Terrimonas sp.]